MAGVPLDIVVNEGGATERGWGEGERGGRRRSTVSGGRGKFSLRIFIAKKCYRYDFNGKLTLVVRLDY